LELYYFMSHRDEPALRRGDPRQGVGAPPFNHGSSPSPIVVPGKPDRLRLYAYELA
jgi:hypothetical protein